MKSAYCDHYFENRVVHSLAIKLLPSAFEMQTQKIPGNKL
jgi:hypothetical protein